jgi:hypothetical protein
MYPDIQSKGISQLLLWFAAYCLNVSDQQLHLEDVDAHEFAILGSVGFLCREELDAIPSHIEKRLRRRSSRGLQRSALMTNDSGLLRSSRTIAKSKDTKSLRRFTTKVLRVPMFEQAFKNIDDVLWKEAGCTTELDYTEQASWLLFLKYLDDLEQDKSSEAALQGKPCRSSHS